MDKSSYRPMMVFSTVLEANQFMCHFVPEHELVWSFAHDYGYSLMDKPFKLTCVVTGLKPQQAKKALHKALERFPGTTMILGLGVCSALVKTANIGDIALPHRVRLENDDVFVIADSKTHYLEEQCVQSSRKVLKALYTCDTHLNSSIDKAAVHVASSCDVYDTSSGAWVKVALQHRISCLICKTVFDTASENLDEELWSCMDKFGKVKARAAFWLILRKPSLYAQFKRLNGMAMKDLLRQQAIFVHGLMKKMNIEQTQGHKKTIVREDPQLSLLNPTQ